MESEEEDPSPEEKRSQPEKEGPSIERPKGQYDDSFAWKISPARLVGGTAAFPHLPLIGIQFSKHR